MIDRELVDCARRAMKRLKAAGLTIVTAESCTAGLVAAALSQAEGAGEALHGSFVAYTKANKAMALAVAVTGVLGPEPDEDGNPVGLVYFACCRRGDEPEIVRKDYGDRPHEALCRAAVWDALAMAGRCADR